MTPFPFDSDAWDRIAFEQVPFSGLARVEGAARKRKIDTPKRGGSDGAYVRIQRRELAEIEITLAGWQPEHLAEMERITELVFPNEATARHHAPVAVAHPALLFHDIDTLFVHEVKGPEAKRDGTFELTLVARQWRPPPRRTLNARPATAPIEQRGTAFTGIEQPRPASPAAAVTPRRRT